MYTSKMNFQLLALSVFSCFLVQNTVCIRIESNGYRDLFIVIDEKVPENKQLLASITDSFTSASRKLFTATKNRLFFKQITVIVPRHWSYDSSYTLISRFTSEDPHVVVENNKKASPRVRKVRCGRGGSVMILPADVLLGSRHFGPLDNLIVHEWGHFRWGVFDEYPAKDHFYLDRGRWEPVRCTKDVKGIADYRCGDLTDGTRNPNKIAKCRFYPDPEQNVDASLMGSSYIKSLTSFCDDNETEETTFHNRQAPNRQNKKCRYQSVWEVLRQHTDFSGGANSSLDSDRNTDPTFIFQQQTAQTMVFVLDVSGSMTAKRLNALRTATEHTIRNLRYGTWVGMVTFASSASTRVTLRNVTSSAVKDYIISRIPTTSDGSTGIGNGVLKAIEVLQTGPVPVKYSTMVVISDGEENVQPYVAEVLDDVIKLNITVHAIGVEKDASDQLTLLTNATGGKYINYLDLGHVSLADAMSQILSSGGLTSNADTPVNIYSTTVYVGSARSARRVTGKFIVENGLGTDTLLTVIFDKEVSATLEVEGPSGHVLHVNGHNTDVMYLNINNSMVGTFNYNLSATGFSGTMAANVLVSSYPVSRDADIIRISTDFSYSIFDFTGDMELAIYTSVFKGSFPVVNATAEVTLETAEGTSSTFMAYDNGVGSDEEEEDGVYSAFVLRKYMDGSGRYGAKVTVAGGVNTAVLVKESEVAEGDTPPPILETVGEFQRVSIPGELTVLNYISNGRDNTPPAAIQDLRLTELTATASGGVQVRNFTISWTAVGNYMDVGNASTYEIRYSESFEQLFQNFQNAPLLPVNLTEFSPSPSGDLEALTVHVSSAEAFEVSAFLAIRAVDSSGNYGKISNIISITVSKDYDIEGLAPSPVRDIDNLEPNSASGLNPGGIVGIVIAALVQNYRI